MKGNDYKILIAMDSELKDTLHHIASQSGETLSAFIRESVKERIENLASCEKGEGNSLGIGGCLVLASHKLGDMWREMKNSVLCRCLFNLAIIGLGMYVYVTCVHVK